MTRSRAGVYQVLNVANGERYIGASANLRKRWETHRSALKHRCHHSARLQGAWDLYGANGFVFGVLEHVPDPERLVEREQHYMDMLNPEYNTSPTAGSPLGCRRSAATRRKIGAALAGKKKPPRSEEHRAKTSAALTGKRLTAEHRRRISAGMTGKKRKPLSEEHKAKISATMKGQKKPPLSEEHRRKISAGMTGKRLTAERKAKISAALVGKKKPPFSEEHRRKIGEANRRRRWEAAKSEGC